MTEHERQLLLDYKTRESSIEEVCDMSIKNGDKSAKTSSSSSCGDAYEKAMPKHGDTLFHKMLSVIAENPGQVLR